MYTNYFSNKDALASKAKEKFAYNESTYMNEIMNSVNNAMEFELREIGPDLYYRPLRINHVELYDCSTAKAIEYFNEPCVVLNFASFKNPGGKFIEGSSAQEEDLCHNSFLYNVLKRCTFWYDKNKKRLNNGLYYNTALYTPSIRFDSGIYADVITCAAPNKSSILRYNKPISKDELRRALFNRINLVLNTAVMTGNKNIVLGAFGCGVFGNDAYEVALYTIYLLENVYSLCMDKVIFAIPGKGSYNYIAFKKLLNERGYDV